MRTTARRPSATAVRALAGLLATALALEVGLAMAPDAAAGAPFDLRALWLGALGVLLGVAALDFARIRSLPDVRVTRLLPGSLALHAWSTVRVVVDTPPGQPALRLMDDHPDQAEVEGLPLAIPAASATSERVERVERAYRLRPMARGDAAFGRLELRATSPFGLWSFTAPCGEPTRVRVYPNFATVARYGELLAADHESHVGIIRRRRRGEGTEFHQLREYRRGDSSRQIDWKATSRRQTLISREHEDERNQQIIFVLDSSRRMRAREEGDLAHFDHALNAMILLAHVALRSGDAVGFSNLGDPARWMPPGKGVSRVTELLDAVYDLEPRTLGADFRAVAEELGRRTARRSLVVLLTTLRREDADDLLDTLAVLRRRHLVLVVDLRPAGLDLARRTPVRDFAGALRFVGSFDAERERRRLSQSLRREGALVLDTRPSALTPRLVSRYLEIKRQGLL